MREIIATGRTVEEATENGCMELGRSRNEVSVEILEMPVNKLFKKIPAKVKITIEEEEAAPEQAARQAASETKAAPVASAKPQEAAPAQQALRQPEKGLILETEPEKPIDLATNKSAAAAVEYLAGIFRAMGAEDIEITAVLQGDATLLRVEGENFADLVDIRGETIQALSYLTDRAVNKGIDKKEQEYLRVRLDVAGYRNRREGELVSLAKKVGQEVVRTKRSRTLAPMNSYERLIVHTAISKIEGLTSESIGADAERRVVIKSTAPDATEGEDWKPYNKKNNRGDKPRRPRPAGNAGGGDRDRRYGNKGGNGGRNNSGPRGGNNGPRPSAPGREFADRPRTGNEAPKVPDRRESIRDGEDLPLYGKIDL
ncbi:MAG: RNA-binding cell elongation regulator Jag/EloR [Oscillospiraceae bacterium]